MELAETAEEGGVSGKPEPALADEGGTDKGGGEADTDDDLPEEVVITEDLGYGIHCPLCFAIHSLFDPAKWAATTNTCADGHQCHGKRLMQMNISRMD